MADPITTDVLQRIVQHLAARHWSTRYIVVLLAEEGSGVVSGAQEHFEDLKLMSRQPLGDAPVPLRFCNPDELND